MCIKLETHSFKYLGAIILYIFLGVISPKVQPVLLKMEVNNCDIVGCGHALASTYLSIDFYCCYFKAFVVIT